MLKRWITAVAGLLCGMVLVFGLTRGGVVQAQGTPCELVNNQERMPVFFAPIYANSQLKDVLPGGTAYTMIQDSGGDGFFRIEYHNGERGWIEFHTRILNGRCADEENMETPLQPLSEFPTVCFYTVSEALPVYSDPALTREHGGFSERGPGTFAVADIWDQAIGLNGSSAMSGGFVEADRGTFSGHCEGTIQLATALDDARVWSAPDATRGQVITTLEIGTEVGITEGPLVGKVREDTMGDWYQIVKGDVSGWVWVDRLEFGRTFTTQQPALASAIAMNHARVWTEPDAQTGQIITTLFAGTDVNIIGEPVEGAIQQDSDLQGIWYPVQKGGTTGWVYEGRLDFANIGD